MWASALPDHSVERVRKEAARPAVEAADDPEVPGFFEVMLGFLDVVGFVERAYQGCECPGGFVFLLGIVLDEAQMPLSVQRCLSGGCRRVTNLLFFYRPQIALVTQHRFSK